MKKKPDPKGSKVKSKAKGILKSITESVVEKKSNLPAKKMAKGKC